MLVFYSNDLNIQKENMIKRLTLVVITAIAAFATQVFAHTKLASSVPAAAVEVTTPSELVLDFSNDVRLTSVVLKTACVWLIAYYDN